VGPTILELLGLERPMEMTGMDLRQLESAGVPA
jgi:bisphosphoglycerate-independent phosphoglycerate mutase (AlkP superfamily)